MKVMVMLPTYNESENIQLIIRTILGPKLTLDTKQLSVESIQVVVIDDNSPDGTAELAEKMLVEFPGKIHVIRRQERGRGTAGITGFKYTITQNVDCLIEMDADFSHNPDDIPRFLKEIKNYDVVIGSRFIPGGQTGARSPSRKLISWGAGFYARLLLGIDVKDWHGGYKCYRKQVLSNLNYENLLSTGYSIGMETIYKLIKGGCSYKEIPITFKERTRGSSKFSLKEVIEYAEMVWKFRWSRN